MPTECQRCDAYPVPDAESNFYRQKGYGLVSVCDDCVSKDTYEKQPLSSIIVEGNYKTATQEAPKLFYSGDIVFYPNTRLNAKGAKRARDIINQARYVREDYNRHTFEQHITNMNPSYLIDPTVALYSLGVNWRATLGDYIPPIPQQYRGEIVNKYDLEEYGDMMKGALRCLETNPPYQRRYNYEGAIRYLIAGTYYLSRAFGNDAKSPFVPNGYATRDILRDNAIGSDSPTQNDPDFDPEKADRNKDGEISDWERAVGNAVAKGIREHKEKKGAETFEAPRISSYYDCEKGRHRWKYGLVGTKYYPTQTEYGDNIIIEENKYTCQDCEIYKTSRNTYDFKEASFERPKTYHMTFGPKKGKVVPIYDEKMERFLEESNAPTYGQTFLYETMRGYGAEGGKVRTMSGKPHTPRKLSKDQNIKPEEARMRKKMEAQSKGKSKCSKHYWDLAVRRNPISGERQFFNQCLLCGKKNFSRGGSAMSDRGFFAEGGSKYMGSHCRDCGRENSKSNPIEVMAGNARCKQGYGCRPIERPPRYFTDSTGNKIDKREYMIDDKGSIFWNCGCEYDAKTKDMTFCRDRAIVPENQRCLYAESYQVREGFDTCETCGDSPLFVSTQIAGGTYCMDCANRVWRAEDEPLFPGLNCSHCGSDEDTYYGEPLTHTPDGMPLSPNDVESKLHIWCDGCGEASPLDEYGAESPFSSDAFNEGRSAGITMFIPEGDAEDYYSNLDTEYMIFYGLSPEDLAKDIDGNSKRYLQFVAGWDDGWNYSTLLHEGVLTDDSNSKGDLEDLDYEMAGEWIYQDFPKGLQEYVQNPKEIGAEIAVMGGILALGLGYFAFKDKTDSTTTKALIGVGIVGAIGVGIKVLGGMQDKGDE